MSNMLATPTKIMKFQSPICQKHAKEFKQIGNLYARKKIMFIGRILSGL